MQEENVAKELAENQTPKHPHKDMKSQFTRRSFIKKSALGAAVAATNLFIFRGLRSAAADSGCDVYQREITYFGTDPTLYCCEDDAEFAALSIDLNNFISEEGEWERHPGNPFCVQIDYPSMLGSPTVTIVQTGTGEWQIIVAGTGLERDCFI